MEQRLGARLLQRFPGRFTLTSLGESVLGNAERIEAEALAAERTIAGRDVALEGVVRVTTVETLADRFLAQALIALQGVHPGIVIELVPEKRSLDLLRREADIALRMRRFEGNQVITRKAGVMALGVFATAEWAERAKNGDIRLVTTLEDQYHLPEIRWFHQQFPHAQIGFRSNSREVQLRAACCGAGVAILSRFLGDAEPGLVRLDMPSAPPALDIWLGVHQDMRHMPRVRVAIDAIVAALEARSEELCPKD